MATAQLTTDRLAEKHRPTLDQALATIRTRAYWSPHPEHPKAYGADGSLDAAAGLAAHQAVLNTRFELDQPGTDDWTGRETSPYGPALGIEYPHPDIDVLLPAMRAGTAAWRDAGPETRALVCLEILSRISARSHEFAHAVMHTSGQAFVMAFQAGGPHAQDRGLEAVAYAYEEQTRTPAGRVDWSKPQGKRDPLELSKEFTPVGRGVALLVGCNTFPTWNGYPGLFASLATGNPVLVKPHPRAVLPLALTVRVAREVLAEAGFDPNLVALAVERPGEGIAKTLAVRPEIRIVDYTGSTAFGDWLEANARQAQVYTEKAGVNTVLIDSTDDYRGMLGNLAFSLSLYSGQMCTTPQNLLIPREGVATDQGPKSYDEVVADLAAAIDGLLGDDTRANGLLGALVNPDVKARVEAAAGLGEVALASREVVNPEYPDAVVRTPVVVKLDGSKPDDQAAFLAECFGPVSFAVSVDSTEQGLDLLRRTIREQGAMTVGAYTTSEETERAVEEVCLEESAQLSLNLTGGVFVNQTAAFSDFHGSGGNPSANAALCDGAFVAHRFRVVEVRRQS
ncbi:MULTISPECIES: phenylacetic acid degradation protein PaaN [unclassified Streptomyces]|uniref:phenylacetic acid degradation protein PaaN n=1 Tax=unclassified Streptomyces TaxID=2593676 RepID=UPI0016616C86|nr:MULTISPECIES: phenylacetic acid degradation protein PaaN [unclassified Streptomyces]MBD0708362.1 phenylacetic acid degradation protein PaaN [Streptomyces sp. CBMA291]MBD0708925.1 phenylacetic acid degradation protein PaaN [Streptomyces sp. CBMA291]MBD0716418.1 phenylacetic acid degradation protein PaaN [Streptomyces sp. CBMA370]